MTSLAKDYRTVKRASFCFCQQHTSIGSEEMKAGYKYCTLYYSMDSSLILALHVGIMTQSHCVEVSRIGRDKLILSLLPKRTLVDLYPLWMLWHWWLNHFFVERIVLRHGDKAYSLCLVRLCWWCSPIVNCKNSRSRLCVELIDLGEALTALLLSFDVHDVSKN